ncbi:MAG: multicopper oxidase family protein [Lyngbya sp.]|nr:multicopper oxidase family protein [Lyngbya sp.]
MINRRKFISLSTSTVGGILLTQCVSNSIKAQSSNSLTQSSVGNLLDVSLEARFDRVSIAGQNAKMLSYNGQIPGPRLETKPGDTVRINFTNKLPQPTNLHYHGLHIPPTGNADNVFLNIPPGESFTYEFTLPKNHPSGTFWYHPHLHGLVAEQLFGGLAGLFIVRGELDEIPEIKAAEEQFLVLKDFALKVNQANFQGHMGIMLGREGELLTVNGELNPNFSIPKGGLLRLRILNASSSRFYRLKLEEHPLYLIATDGGSISEPVELSEVLLTPGERVEILVRGEREPGQYRLLNLPYDRTGGMMGRGMMGRGMMGNSANTNTPQTLATLSYNNSVETLPLPKQLIAVPELPKPQETRRLTLNHGMAPGMGMVFLINGEPFEMGNPDTVVKLNTVEDWEIANTGTMDHPFHLHINDFQVMSRDNKPEPYRAWKDTTLVKRGEVVRIRIPFKDYPGKTVYHCHILDHEDLGMMATIDMKA